MNNLPNWWHYDKPYAIKDSLYVMKSIPHDSIDLIVTSPPYNLGINYGDMVNDSLPYEKYIENLVYMFEDMYRILKPDGRICVNSYLSYGTAKARYTPISDINTICNEIGFKHHAIIVWDERTVCKKSAFGSFKSASSPYISSPVEGILVMYKNQWKKLNRGISDITGKEFSAWTLGRWTMTPDRKSEHPAPFPVELPLRCIKLLSYVGDVIFDPFLGSGTTIKAATMCNRIGLGVEINPEYEPEIIQKINSFKPSKNMEEFF